jgi:hypothetical protein
VAEPTRCRCALTCRASDPADEFDPDDFADWQDTDTCPPGTCPYDSADYIDDDGP